LRTALIRSASSSGEAANRRLKTKSFLGSSRALDTGNLLVGAWPPSVGGGEIMALLRQVAKGQACNHPASAPAGMPPALVIEQRKEHPACRSIPLVRFVPQHTLCPLVVAPK